MFLFHILFFVIPQERSEDERWIKTQCGMQANRYTQSKADDIEMAAWYSTGMFVQGYYKRGRF